MSSNNNFQSIADWQPPETLPKDTIGEYLVLIRSRPYGGGRQRPDDLQVYKVRPISNGIMRMVGNHFAWDVLTKDTRIVAWAHRPESPVWLEPDPEVQKED